MFTKTQKFKALLKEAYKAGCLQMYRPNEDVLVIITGYTIFNLKIKYLEKEEKAAIIEFAGELPEIGECFKCSESGNQEVLEAVVEDVWNLGIAYMNGTDEYAQTYIIVDTNSGLIRGIQNKASNQMLWFQDRYLQIIDISKMARGEVPPEHFRISKNMIIWQNNIMAYGLLRFDMKNPELNALLENMELYDSKRDH